MRKWFRITLKLILLALIVSAAIYILLPSNIEFQETIRLKCSPKNAFEKFSDPGYWISRSLILSGKKRDIKVSHSEQNKPTVYYWYNKKRLCGSIQKSESRKFGYVAYSLKVMKSTSGDLAFTIADLGLYTAVNATLELELPDSFLEKVQVYIGYLSIQKDIRNGLKSIAVDCELNSKRKLFHVAEGSIKEMVTVAKKVFIPNRHKGQLFYQMRLLQNNFPNNMTNGRPFAQLVNSPFDDTLIVYLSIPVKKGSLNRVPNTVLTSIPKTKTLFTAFSPSTDSLDDVYNQLLSQAKSRKKVTIGFPIIIYSSNGSKGVMHLPVS